MSDNSSTVNTQAGTGAAQSAAPASAQVPWYVQMEQESQQIADKIGHDAEAAAHLSQKDMAAFQKDGDLGEKWAAEKASADEKEQERDAKLAEELAEERMEFAVRQGELQTADAILEKDPTLITTDQNMMIPNGKDPELKAETTF